MTGLSDLTYENIVKFYAVPYAEPPVRFAAPVHKKVTGEPIDATKPGFNCKSPRGDDEDCLNVNIYVPEVALSGGNDPLPVLLNFHGGAFFVGNNDDDRLQPEYLVQEQVIYNS